MSSIVVLRATPIKVGGRHPSIRFSSDFEDKEFSLSIKEDNARKIGAFLYKEVEIEATVTRNTDGTIKEGELTSFTPVEEGNPIAAWENWYEKCGQHFSSIEEAQQALRDSRSDDDLGLIQ